MYAYLQWMPKVLARSGSRLCWPALSLGLVGALAIQLCFLSVLYFSANDIAAARTAAMICACFACFAAATIAGLVAHRAHHAYVATNTYLAWVSANVVLAANVGLTTDPTG
jgi:hypothetical protein